MKVHWAVLFLCLSGVCFLADYPAYGLSLKAGNEQLELYLEKLQANIIEEEKAVELLKKRYADVLSSKQSPPEQGGQQEKNKQLDRLASERTVREAKLKDLEARQEVLRQKNQELLNSLEQSIASIQSKDKTIEELKKNRPGRDSAQSGPRPDKKGQPACLVASASASQRRDGKPRAGKAGNEKRKKEIKEDSLSGKSIDFENSGNDQASCFDPGRENKPRILKGFLGKAKKLDSWWREKVW